MSTDTYQKPDHLTLVRSQHNPQHGVGYYMYTVGVRKKGYFTEQQMRTALMLIEHWKIHELTMAETKKLNDRLGPLAAKIAIMAFIRGAGAEIIEKECAMPARSFKYVLKIILEQLKDWPDI